MNIDATMGKSPPSKQEGLLRIDFLFGVLTSSIALWYIFLEKIIDLTREEPADYSILFLGFVHFLLFLLLSVTAFLVWERGIRMVAVAGVNRRITVWAEKLSNSVATWWLPISIIVLVSLAMVSAFGESGWFEVVELVSVVLAFLVILLAQWIMGWPIRERLFRKLGYAIIVFLIGFMIYVSIMSLIFADARVTTDRQLYTVQDSVKVSVVESGYILNPSIDTVYFAFLKHPSLAVGPSDIQFLPHDYEPYPNPMNDYLAVQIVPQIIPVTKIKYFPIHIVSSTQGATNP